MVYNLLATNRTLVPVRIVSLGIKQICPSGKLLLSEKSHACIAVALLI